jgi:hypothetical protein
MALENFVGLCSYHGGNAYGIANHISQDWTFDMFEAVGEKTWLFSINGS